MGKYCCMYINDQEASCGEGEDNNTQSEAPALTAEEQLQCEE